MMKPVIHLNGTSRNELRRGYYDAYCAVQSAADVLAQTNPNGRDYYPLGPDAIRSAGNEHAARMRRLKEVLDELEELTLHCGGDPQ